MSAQPASLREAFHVEQPASTVWARLRLADAPLAAGSRCRIPGFPSADGGPGCAARVDAAVPQRSLRATKQDRPCAGSRIAVAIAPANASGWPTRVTVAQTDLPSVMAAMPDAVAAHWRQIVADFRLYLEREVLAPRTTPAADFGALAKETPVGVELLAVAGGGFAERCGMRRGDLLLALQGVRIYGLAQLWTVLAVSAKGEEASAVWVRDGLRCGAAAL